MDLRSTHVIENDLILRSLITSAKTSFSGVSLVAWWVRLCVLNVRAQVLFQVRELDPTYSVVRAAKKRRPCLQIKLPSKILAVRISTLGIWQGGGHTLNSLHVQLGGTAGEEFLHWETGASCRAAGTPVPPSLGGRGHTLLEYKQTLPWGRGGKGAAGGMGRKPLGFH